MFVRIWNPRSNRVHFVNAPVLKYITIVLIKIENKIIHYHRLDKNKSTVYDTNREMYCIHEFVYYVLTVLYFYNNVVYRYPWMDCSWNGCYVYFVLFDSYWRLSMKTNLFLYLRWVFVFLLWNNFFQKYLKRILNYK